MTQQHPKSVIGKVAMILDALSESDGVLGLSELARSSGLPKSTVHRICGELVTWGVVERSGDAFRLGSRLFELGSRVPGRRLLRDTALPIMEDLSTATQQTVHLAVLEGLEVMYVERLPGRSAAEVPSSVAGRLPLHCTATGRCLLANGPQRLLDRVLAGPLGALTENSITDAEVLRKTLSTVAREGFAIEQGEVSDGLMSIGAPVFELGDRLAGALAVTGPVDAFSPDPGSASASASDSGAEAAPNIASDIVTGTVEMVCAAAGELSRRLGASVR
jgi:DNA-binding IclR family transcriptional regulator